MNRDEFEYALLLHGSDLSKWPDTAAAEARLSADPGARALLEEARRLDARLAEATAYPPLDSVSIGRVIARHRRSPATSRALSARQLAAATALASCIVASGFVLGQANAINAAQADIALIALAGGDLDLLGDLP